MIPGVGGGSSVNNTQNTASGTGGERVTTAGGGISFGAVNVPAKMPAWAWPLIALAIALAVALAIKTVK